MEAIEFTEEQITTLHDVISSYMAELHTEISYTDDRDFKAALKRKQATLQEVLEKLGATVAQEV